MTMGFPPSLTSTKPYEQPCAGSISSPGKTRAEKIFPPSLAKNARMHQLEVLGPQGAGLEGINCARYLLTGMELPVEIISLAPKSTTG